MKKLLLYSLIGLFLSSCGKTSPTVYEIQKIHYIPDSLKQQHRDWIQETVRAASQHMAAGKYQNIDKTIRQAKFTADEIFGVSEIGLIKRLSEKSWSYIEIRQEDMTEEEKLIFGKLLKNPK